MSVSIMQREAGTVASVFNDSSSGKQSAVVLPLTESERAEALAFLSARPLHTVCMSSYILDNGVVSPLNRGAFYACRNIEGVLEGVGLIGHATLIEAQNEAALRAFAGLKQQYSASKFIRGEQEMIDRFWRYYSEYGHTPRMLCRELLLEQRSAQKVAGASPELIPADPGDLEDIVAINAMMVQAECGINPLEKDPEGFRQRIARRIEKKRFLVWKKSGKLVFKADVFAETPEVSYLEGIYVDPQMRGKGHGSRCLSRLGHLLLERSQSTCLLVNKQNKSLTEFYCRAGYEFRGYYDTIYLHTEAS